MNKPVIAQPIMPQAPASRPLVRIVIVGHVDHGKSTLIGRLLYETGSLADGKLTTLQSVSARRGMAFEWSFLLDSLQTERDQGITIDTSQIRFATATRDFVLIDAPGHAEFLRNMITGAAQADAALLMVDASEGVRDQTRRHGYLLHLLGIHQIAVVINKMDRVDFAERQFRSLEAEIAAHLLNLGLAVQAVIPVSAREGDGVAQMSSRLAWYDGPSVLETLHGFTPARPADELPLRLPVQAVYKFDERRILAGRLETGRVSVGEEVVIVPSGKISRIRSVECWPARPHPVRTARSGQSIGITLDDDVFVERGEIIAAAAMRPKATRRWRLRIFWLGDQPLRTGETITFRIGTAESRGSVVSITNSFDPGRLSVDVERTIAQHHVGEIEVMLARPLAADPYSVNPRTGRVVLEVAGRIVGGGLILSGIASADRTAAPGANAVNVVPVDSAVSAREWARRSGHAGAVVWLTGLPGSGKSTLGQALERRIFDRGGVPVLLDGDTLRAGLNTDLGFDAVGRSENVRRIAEVAAHLARSGLLVIVAAVSPSAQDRTRARNIVGTGFYEVHVAAPMEVCESRDPKGHYRRARVGEIPAFTGVSAPYEPPERPDLIVETNRLNVTLAVEQLERFLEDADILHRRGQPTADASI